MKIVVQREGVEKPIEFEISRGRVEVETVLGFKRKDNDDWDFMIDPTSKIGYARVTSFSRNTARDLLKVMRELVSSGVKGFVLDLRFNPGGLLDSAVDISDLFIGDGLIVSIRPDRGVSKNIQAFLMGACLIFPWLALLMVEVPVVAKLFLLLFRITIVRLSSVKEAMEKAVCRTSKPLAMAN